MAPILEASVTKLAKFRQFVKNLVRVHLVFSKITNLLWRIPFAFGPIFIFAIFIISKNNLSIWSHCYRPTMQKPLNYYYLLVNSLKVVFAQPQQQQRRRQPNIQGAFYGVPFIHACRYQCCSSRRQTVSGKTPPGFNVCIKLLQQL